LLLAEISALTKRQWEDVPGLKKKKVILASRLRELDLTSGPIEEEPYDLRMLKSLVADLEDHYRVKVEQQLGLIDNQVLALQELHQYWREDLNVSFRKFCVPRASP
jgi:hypothetical protein